MAVIDTSAVRILPDFDGFGRRYSTGLRSHVGRRPVAVPVTVDKSSLKRAAATISAGLAAGFAGAGVAAGKFFASSVKVASNLQEVQNQINTLFGKGADEVRKFGRDAADSIGQSERAALAGAASLAAYGKQAGLSDKSLVKFSTRLVGLASDMASFADTSPEEAVQAIGAAMRGELDPIEKYKVVLNETTLRQVAFKKGIVETTKQALTPQQRVLAVQAALYDQLGKKGLNVQGDFAKTQESLANQQRKLSAVWDNMKAKVGTGLLPAVSRFTKVLRTAVVPAMQALWDKHGPAVVRFADRAAAAIERFAASAKKSGLSKAFADMGGKAGDAAKKAGPLFDKLKNIDWAEVGKNAATITGLLIAFKSIKMVTVAPMLTLLGVLSAKYPDETRKFLEGVAGAIGTAIKWAADNPAGAAALLALLVAMKAAGGGNPLGALGRVGSMVFNYIEDKKVWAWRVDLLATVKAIAGKLGVAPVPGAADGRGKKGGKHRAGPGAPAAPAAGGGQPRPGGGGLGSLGRTAGGAVKSIPVLGAMAAALTGSAGEFGRAAAGKPASATGLATGAFPILAGKAFHGLSGGASEKGVGEGLKAIGGKIQTFFTELGPKITGWMSTAWQGALGFVQSLPGRIIGFLTSLPSRIATLAGNAVGMLIVGFTQGIPALAAGIGGIVASVVGWFAALPGRLLTIAGNMVGFLIVGVTQGIPALASGIGNVISSIAGWFGALPGRLLRIAGSMIGFLIVGVTQGIPALARGIGSVISSVIAWFGALPGRVYTAAVPIVTRVGEIAGAALDWFRTLPGRAVEFVSKLPGMIWSAIKSIPGFFGRMWSMISDAFAAGVNAAIGLLNDFLGGINAVTSKFGIRIPLVGLMARDRGATPGRNTGDKISGKTKLAAGGKVPGSSPHPRADNVPLWATAGEFMHPVRAVKHYGLGMMEAIRTLRYPRPDTHGADTPRYAGGGRVWPLPNNFRSVSSAYGQDRGSYSHGGTDFAAPTGTPVSSSAAGRVVQAGWYGGGGNTVSVKHNGITTRYMHLSATLARVGELVRAGQLIGRVGSTGDSSGPHLHFQVERGGGATMDPMAFLSGAGDAGLFSGALEAVKKVASKMFDALASKAGSIRPDWLGGLTRAFGKKLVGAIPDWVADKLGEAGDTIMGAAGADNAAQKYAKGRLGSFGWGGAQWDALKKLWTGESGWNANAVNPSSGAYGIPQILPSAHGRPVALGDYRGQVDWGLRYIRNRYGSPSAAWAFWNAQNPHWYDQGGWLQPGATAINATGKRERVIGPQEGAEFDAFQAMKRLEPGGEVGQYRKTRGRQHDTAAGANYLVKAAGSGAAQRLRRMLAGVADFQMSKKPATRAAYLRALSARVNDLFGKMLPGPVPAAAVPHVRRYRAAMTGVNNEVSDVAATVDGSAVKRIRSLASGLTFTGRWRQISKLAAKLPGEKAKHIADIAAAFIPKPKPKPAPAPTPAPSAPAASPEPSAGRARRSRRGMVRTEDGHWVPRSFYSKSPDMVQAEDGSWVPRSFYAKGGRVVQPPAVRAVRRVRQLAKTAPGRAARLAQRIASSDAAAARVRALAADLVRVREVRGDIFGGRTAASIRDLAGEMLSSKAPERTARQIADVAGDIRRVKKMGNKANPQRVAYRVAQRVTRMIDNIRTLGLSMLGRARGGSARIRGQFPDQFADTAAQKYAMGRLGKFGWRTDVHFAPLKRLWARVSGWNAGNVRRGRGIPGAVPATHGVTLPLGDYRKQIDWGLTYIRNRYGTPERAYRMFASRDPRWYDSGGWLEPGTTAINGTGRRERVIGPQEGDAFDRFQSGQPNGGGGGAVRIDPRDLHTLARLIADAASRRPIDMDGRRVAAAVNGYAYLPGGV